MSDPSVSPEPILQVCAGLWAAGALKSGVDLKLFDALAAGPQDVAALSHTLGAAPQSLRIVLDALVALGFVARQAQGYTLTAVSSTFLVSSQPTYLGALVADNATSAAVFDVCKDYRRVVTEGYRPDLNSIAWIVWHMARAEDFGVQRLVGHRPQIFDQEGWMARLNVPLRHCGTAMADEEVSDLSLRIDLAALRDYWAAVGRGTLAVVRTLHPDDLDEVIDPAFLHHVIVDEGVFGPNTDFVEPLYRGHNKGFFLAHLGLTHNYEHAAEALVIRGLLGFRRR